MLPQDACRTPFRATISSSDGGSHRPSTKSNIGRVTSSRKVSPRSALRRALTFVRYVIGTRVRDANTLRYLWNEAAYDVRSAP